MTAPKTLLEMAGLSSTPPPLDKLSLVLIDMQMEYVSGALPLPGAAAAIDEAAKVLALARTAGRPIVHVQHKGRAGGIFDPGSPGFAVAPQLQPTGSEVVITKTMPNSFIATELESVLKDLGASQLLFVGFMTHMCVSSTVRGALDRGFFSAVVAAACGTRDLPDGQGGVIPAQALHRAELAALADRFALVVDSADGLIGSAR